MAIFNRHTGLYLAIAYDTFTVPVISSSIISIFDCNSRGMLFNLYVLITLIFSIGIVFEISDVIGPGNIVFHFLVS